MTWQQKAACLNSTEIHPDSFFPTLGVDGVFAKEFCVERCDVREECLTYALDANIRYGIWGGLDDDERQTLRRRMQRSATATKRAQDPEAQALLEASDDAVAS